ncbi:helix-turn-helix domain-containing protein [uncultured Mitsuokella sp.]|uniref:helix-turn-helix domain-containing protein n=1 Tax=uncultured Mitsuokella sp. TaxID=453120 RepID=UPI0026DA7FA8|nr:helix-turn-helix domain-containing protein [uncultured Mitsuokella sp.]
MSVIRVEKTSNYTVMANYHFKEKGLSLKAKGIMSLMLSLPDDWDYTVEGLATLSKDGINSVRSALKELENFHYLVMERERDKKGILRGTVYTLYEKPIVDNPILEKPILDEPILENRTQLNTNLSSTKEVSTKRQITPRERKDPFAAASSKLQEALRDFEASRKALHKPLTLKAKELIVKKLEKLAPGNEMMQIAILEQSIERGWQGVFPLKQDSRWQRDDDMPPEYKEAAKALQMIKELEGTGGEDNGGEIEWPDTLKDY